MAERSQSVSPAPALAESSPSGPGRHGIAALILVLAIVLVYSPVWQAGFIWDDDAHVTRADLRSWAGLERIWFELGATQQYYPVVHSAFWLEHRLWGDEPLGYHLVNVLLYAFSALLLLRILRQLEVPGAWLATAIFALHPVQVESVAWVTELKNILSGVFYFSAALAYLRFDRTRDARSYLSSLLLFALGLMSKSVIATLPAALLIVFWWKRGRLSWKQDIRPLLPFFAVGAFCGLFTAWVERRYIGAEGIEYHLSLIERSLIAGHAVWFYLSKLAWPANLIFNYPRWHIEATAWRQYLFPAATLIVAALLVGLSRVWRGPLAGFLFFVGTLFPALGFLNVYPFRYSFVADHFQYLACLGIIVPGAAGLTLLADKLLPARKPLQTIAGAALLLVIGSLSWEQAWVYANEKMLWTETLAQNPDSWMAHNYLGMILFQEGHTDEAMAEFQKALAINPTHAKAHYNIGDLLFQKGDVDGAIVEYQKSVAADPTFPYAHYNLGAALLQKGRVDEAIVQFQKCLQLEPGEPHATEKLAQAMARQASSPQ